MRHDRKYRELEKLIFNIALNILESEIKHFDHNPQDYLRAMGWIVEKYPHIDELIDTIPITEKAIKALQKQLMPIMMKSKNQDNIPELSLELCESNPASDYPVNYIAGYINKHYPKLK